MTVRDPGAQHATEPLEEKWPGLAAFTEEQQRFFYGRASELDELHRRVEREPLCVLFGQSGLGKTSLLQAGLFPRLRAIGYLPVSVRIDYAPDAPPPEDQLRRALDEALAQHGVRPAARPRADETLWEYFHRVDGQAAGPTGRPVVAVLVLDQFEEVFTLGQSRVPGRVEELIEVLAGLIENRVPAAVERRLEAKPELVESLAFDREDHRVLLSLREDYLPHLQDLRRHLPSVMQNAMRLTRLDAPQALEAVLGPGGDLVTPAVARRIVAFVAAAGQSPEVSREGAMAGVEVEPALLSLVCRELDNRRLAARLPAITEDLLAGSSEDILRDFYDRCLADQPVAVRAFVEDELLSQGVEAQGGRVFRESISRERARRLLAQRGVPPATLETLIERRLLHVEERLGVDRVELTHDVLIEVVRRSRSERLQRETVEQAEREAEEARARLWRGRRRAALVVGGLAVLAAGAIVIAAGTRRSNRHLEALADSLRQQTARADSARAVADTNVVLAQLAAIEANRMADTAETERNRALAARESALRNEEIAVRTGTEADTLTKLFSAYALEALQDLSDSSYQRRENVGLYRGLLRTSDKYVEEMRKVSERREPAKLQVVVKTLRAVQERRGARFERGPAKDSLERAAPVTARQAIDSARALLREFDTPDARSIAAYGFLESGSVLQELNDYRGALAAATEGITAARGLDPTVSSLALDRLSRLHQLRANALLRLNDSLAAERAQDSSIAVARRNLAFRRDERAERLLSTAVDFWGYIRYVRGSYPAALVAYREQLQIDQQLARTNSTEALRNLAWSWGRMGQVYEKLDSFPAAEAAHIRRIEFRDTVATRTRDDSDRNDLSTSRLQLSGLYDRWGDLLLGRGDTVGARRRYRQEEAIDRGLLAGDTSAANLRSLATTLGKVETTLRDRDSLAARIGLLEERLTLRRGVMRRGETAEHLRELAQAVEDLALARNAGSGPLDSVAVNRRTVAVLDSVWRLDSLSALLSRMLAIANGALGQQLHARDSFPAAARAYERRVELLRAVHRQDPGRATATALSEALGALAFYQLFLPRPAEALAASQEALQINPDSTWLNTNLAHALLLLGRTGEAEAVYRRYVGQVIWRPNRTWETLVREDLCDLVLKEAITAAQADQVDGWLQTSGSGAADRWRSMSKCKGSDE